MIDSVDLLRDVCRPPANYDQDLSQMLRDLSSKRFVCRDPGFGPALKTRTRVLLPPGYRKPIADPALSCLNEARWEPIIHQAPRYRLIHAPAAN